MHSVFFKVDWSWFLLKRILGIVREITQKEFVRFLTYYVRILFISGMKYLAQFQYKLATLVIFLNKFIKKEMPLIFCFLPNQNDVVSFKQKTKGQNYFPFAWFFLEFIFKFEDFYLSKLTRAKMLSVLLSINNLENMTFLFSVFFCFI